MLKAQRRFHLSELFIICQLGEVMQQVTLLFQKITPLVNVARSKNKF
jgi:hypothetical protein